MLRRIFISALTSVSLLLAGKKRAAAMHSSPSKDKYEEDYAFFSSDASSLGLKISGYQFPKELHDPYDSNWLMIAGKVTLEGRYWSFLDPCLLTTEVSQLADWLEAVVSNDAVQNDCGFIEPNLHFIRTNKNIIRINLSLEARPPWADKDDHETEYGFEMPITSGLLTVAADLRGQLKKFPERG